MISSNQDFIYLRPFKVISCEILRSLWTLLGSSKEPTHLAVTDFNYKQAINRKTIKFCCWSIYLSPISGRGS